VLEVVEHDEHVGQHQRHVGEPEDVGVGLGERRLDGAHEVVAEVADGAAGERGSAGEGRLAQRRGAPGDGVRVARIAQRPAHHLARAHADERVAPDALALLGGLQQEGRVLRPPAAELQERRDRRLAVVDEGVAQRDEIVVARQLADLLEGRFDGETVAARRSLWRVRARKASLQASPSAVSGGAH
jgi:hypothetical protein